MQMLGKTITNINEQPKNRQYNRKLNNKGKADLFVD